MQGSQNIQGKNEEENAIKRAFVIFLPRFLCSALQEEPASIFIYMKHYREVYEKYRSNEYDFFYKLYFSHVQAAGRI